MGSGMRTAVYLDVTMAKKDGGGWSQKLFIRREERYFLMLSVATIFYKGGKARIWN